MVFNTMLILYITNPLLKVVYFILKIKYRLFVNYTKFIFTYIYPIFENIITLLNARRTISLTRQYDHNNLSLNEQLNIINIIIDLTNSNEMSLEDLHFNYQYFNDNTNNHTYINNPDLINVREITINRNIEDNPFSLPEYKEPLAFPNIVIIKYTDNDMTNFNNKTCHICFEKSNIVFNCNHYNCATCYLNMIKYNHKLCPECRQPITTVKLFTE